MDFKSGEKRDLSGRYMNEQFAFTGRGGNFVRWGATGMKTRGYDQSIGAHFTLVSGKDKPAKDIWRIKRPYHVALGVSPVCLGPKCNLFAIRLPKPPGADSSSSWHLMNREGKTWQFPGKDIREYLGLSKLLQHSLHNG